jgi:hypothetical protein
MEDRRLSYTRSQNGEVTKMEDRRRFISYTRSQNGEVTKMEETVHKPHPQAVIGYTRSQKGEATKMEDRSFPRKWWYTRSIAEVMMRIMSMYRVHN